jgi:hypothetical protein
LQSDGRFQVVGLNRPRVNAAGTTDADIVFRHQATGLQGRMEVKNMSPASQRASLAKIKSQIVKMARDARATGEIQVWANRQQVLPEIRAFAERQGVQVVERLRTGNSNVRSQDVRFRDFANAMDARCRFQARLTTVMGSVQLGMGAYMACQAVQQLEKDLAQFQGTQSEWLQVGEHGSTLLAGGSFTVAGAAQLARQVPGLANSSRLLMLSKWGGRLGLAGMAVTEGILVSQYASGQVTERQFVRGQVSLGGGLAGGTAGSMAGFYAGAWTGAAIGSFFGPAGAATGAGIGGTIGLLGGGLGGGYVGAQYAGYGLESYYQLQDREQHERYVQFLLRHYQFR